MRRRRVIGWVIGIGAVLFVLVRAPMYLVGRYDRCRCADGTLVEGPNRAPEDGDESCERQCAEHGGGIPIHPGATTPWRKSRCDELIVNRGDMQDSAGCDLEYGVDDPGDEPRNLELPDAGIQRLILFHGPCLGTCPIYSVWVWSSGRVEYSGGGFVGHQGCFTRKIGEPAAQALFADVLDAGFGSMPRLYAKSWTDLPSTVIAATFPWSRDGWCVEHAGEFSAAPPAFHEIEARIEAASGYRELADGWDAGTPASP